jgi:hypothetical protein
MCRTTLENYLSKTAAGLRQSGLLVGESLHNDTGLDPVLLCADIPTASSIVFRFSGLHRM